MAFLGKIKILHKIFGVIGLMSAVSIGLSYLGISTMAKLNGDAVEIDRVCNNALLVTRLGTAAMTMSRGEFQIASDPRQENISAILPQIAAEEKELDKLFTRLGKGVTAPDRIEKLKQIRTMMTEYKAIVDHTAKRASSVNVTMTAEMEELQAEARASKDKTDKLEAALAELAKAMNNEVDHVTESASAEYQFALRLVLVIAITGIAVSILVGFVIGHFGVAKPIRTIVEILQKLAQGNFSLDISGGDRRDEVGDVARAAVVFKQNGLDKEQLLREQEEQEARAAAQKRADMNRLADAFEAEVMNIVQSVSAAAEQLKQNAVTMSSAAEETSRQSTVVVSASEETSASVETVAAAAEELSSSIGEIGQQVTSAVSSAEDANKQLGSVTNVVQTLVSNAQRIGEIVDLINNIASQTNLLALNATIEAARAGEMGKGFAIVAAEVKELARQTSNATDEVSTQINAVQSATSQVADAMKSFTETIGQIDEISATISAAVTEQGAATSEIARSVSEAAKGTQEVSANIAGVQKAAEQTGQTSGEIVNAAVDLSSQATALNGQVAAFIERVRAA